MSLITHQPVIQVYADRLDFAEITSGNKTTQIVYGMPKTYDDCVGGIIEIINVYNGERMFMCTAGVNDYATMYDSLVGEGWRTVYPYKNSLTEAYRYFLRFNNTETVAEEGGINAIRLSPIVDDV